MAIIPVNRRMFFIGMSLSSVFINWDTNTELKKIATNKEDPSTMDRVIGRMTINCPIIPGQSPKGINAATVVAVEIIIGNAISPIPFLAASIRVIPSSSIKRYTFSTTTIPLSTSIPSPIINPNNTIVFKVYPKAPNIIKDMNMDIGMAKPTKMAFLNPKKNINTMTTKITPKIILFTKSSTWPMVFGDWSLAMVTFKSDGKLFSRAAFTMAPTLSAAATIFSPDLFFTSNMTTGAPFSLA